MSDRSVKRRKTDKISEYNITDVTDELAGLNVCGRLCTKQAPDSEYVSCLDVQKSSSCLEGDVKVAAAYTNHEVIVYSAASSKLLGKLLGHNNSVTNIKFAHLSSHLIFTSSLDKSLRCWDLRTMKAEQMFEGYEEVDRALLSFDLSCDDELLCAGTEAGGDEDVYMLFWDVRKLQPQGYYRDSHQDDITQVRFHPCRSELLLTGSMDGLVCQFDVSQGSEDDALLYTYNCSSSVSTIGWWGSTWSNGFSCTHDGGVSVYNSEGDVISSLRNVRELVKDITVDYVVDCLPNAAALYPLMGTYSGGLHLYRLDEGKSKLHRVTSLTGGHTATVRCAAWDDSSKMLYTGGEDSKLLTWSVQS